MMQKTDRIWLDGQLVPWDEAQVHVLTHTLHYGLGVFEGIRCYQQRDGRSAIFRLREHIDRLFGSAHVLDLAMPWSREQIMEACRDTVRANDLRECYLRPIAFLGDGEMGLVGASADARRDRGVALGRVPGRRGREARRPAEDQLLPALPPEHAAHQGEGGRTLRQLDPRGAGSARIAGTTKRSCSTSTATCRRPAARTSSSSSRASAKTTPLPTVLGGITRDAALRLLGDAGVAIREERFTRDEVYLAEEAFLTGTAVEITPIRELDGRRIGTGRPGPVTTRVQELFFSIIRGAEPRYTSWLTPI